METFVVSDRLTELLTDKVVQAAVFTTFGLEIDFLELEVFPLLMSNKTAYSSDPEVKKFQVKENLFESSISIDVFYDLPLYRETGDRSPEMEYGCHGVMLGSHRAFHAKNNYILAFDTVHEMPCILVSAGSNNLTSAGWWDNVEVQHWHVVYSGEVSRKFLNQLDSDMTFLGELSPVVKANAVAKVRDAAADMKSSHDYSMDTAFYGIADATDFPKFMKAQAKTFMSSYSNWTLEIISPYFSNQPENNEYQFFWDLGVESIHVLLPRNQEDVALVDEALVQAIEEAEGIEWAEWNESAGKKLGLGGQHYRRLHAKVYHFYNRKQSWMFVGSVNFSQQAFHRNVESGFFVKLSGATRLLDPIQNASAIRCEPPTEVVPGFEQSDSEVPVVQLGYDWKTDCLTGALLSDTPRMICIQDAEQNEVVADWLLTKQTGIYPGDLEPLRAVLTHGSLVKVKVDGYGFTQVLLQQTGWSHKPQKLPNLTMTQILSIYADLSPERRQLLLLDARIRQLLDAHQAGELNLAEVQDDAEQFFSEYAEIFHAFRQLRLKLNNALEAGKEAQVDYYLTGTGMDSVPSLVDRALEVVSDSDKQSSVTSYLILLCCIELMGDKDFRKRMGVKKFRDQVSKHVKKQRERIVLEDNSKEKRKAFFDWFESQFFHRKARLLT